MKKKYSGIVIPAITPLTADHKLDKASAEKMLSNFRSHEVSPFILGTTGESASLPAGVKLDFIRLAGKCKQPNEVFYSGIAATCLSESVELAKQCFDAGIDVVAAHLPSYYTLSEDQMLRYFEQLADAVSGPLVIYNIPATTHMTIPLSVIDRLSHHEHIVGTKDSERSEERLQQSIKLWAHREDFSHFLGWAAQSAYALLHGSDGLIPSTGNLHPGLYQALAKAALHANHDEAHRLQIQSDELGAMYQSGRSLGDSLWALKTLMSDAGICAPHMMPPLTEGSTEDANNLKQQLHQYLEAQNISLEAQLQNS